MLVVIMTFFIVGLSILLDKLKSFRYVESIIDRLSTYFSLFKANYRYPHSDVNSLGNIKNQNGRFNLLLIV